MHRIEGDEATKVPGRVSSVVVSGWNFKGRIWGLEWKLGVEKDERRMEVGMIWKIPWVDHQENHESKATNYNF